MLKSKMKHTFIHELGVEAESNISGFKGIVISRAQHVNGCDRYYIQPKVDKDGKLPDGCWFDEGELVVISEAKVERKNNDRGGFASQIK